MPVGVQSHGHPCEITAVDDAVYFANRSRYALYYISSARSPTRHDILKTKIFIEYLATLDASLLLF